MVKRFPKRCHPGDGPDVERSPASRTSTQHVELEQLPIVIVYDRTQLRRQAIQQMYQRRWLLFTGAMAMRTAAVCHAVDLQYDIAVDPCLYRRLRALQQHIMRRGYLWGQHREMVFFRRSFEAAIRLEEAINAREVNESRKRKSKRRFPALT